MNANEEVPKVYAAISAVMHDLSKEGISKNRKNQSQGYNFRGIDDIYNALAPILAEHKLSMLPRVLEKEVTERASKQGGVLIYTTIKVAFDLVSAIDGSRHEIITYGEAMDSGDKSVNKAMAAAVKYAAMIAFFIPTEGDNDADATTHEVAPTKPLAKPAAPRQPADKAATQTPAQKARAAADAILKRQHAAMTEPDMHAIATDPEVVSYRKRFGEAYKDLEAELVAADQQMIARIHGLPITGEDRLSA